MLNEKACISGYSHFIENMPDGFVYLESIEDDSGKLIDYVFIKANSSFEQLTEMKARLLLGKRVTEVFPGGRMEGFDFMSIYNRPDMMGDNNKFECFSSRLGKWYLVYHYKIGGKYLCLVFHDITETKKRTEKINILHKSLGKFNKTTFMDIDYQWMADELRKLSGAAFVLVNVFDKASMKAAVCGLSGLDGKVRQAVKILGFEVIDKAWDVDEADLAVMESKKLVKVGRFKELNRQRISPHIGKMLEKVLRLGDFYGIGVSYNNEVLGSFLITMREGDEVESPDIVELFANQLGIMVLRNKAQEEVEKIDREYRTVFNGSQDAMFLVNVNDEKSFTYYMINKGYELDVGISSEMVYGLTPQDLYGKLFGDQIVSHYIDCIAAGKPITYEETFSVNGVQKVWHTLLSPIMKEGRVAQIVGSSRNITELKKWENEVARERQFFKTTLHSIGDAVITTNTENRIVILNKAAEAITGWTQEEARGKLLGEVMKTIAGKEPDELTNEGQPGYEKLIVSKDGSKRIISSSEAFIRDEPGNILGVVIVFRDITLEKQKEEEVRYLGYHDSMTGLYNRAYFEEALNRLNDEKYLPLGLIMGDSNGLKMINDVFGHEEGDRLLKNITQIFRSICGSEDIIARIGGDEFAVILPRTSIEKMNIITSNVKRMCSLSTGESICTSVALGAALKSDTSQSIEEVYKLAEDRMYNNKLVESKSIRSSIITSLKKTLEERTHETEAHAQRMNEISGQVGKIMGLHDNELDELSLLAMLHDIGKIAIPDYILGKSGKLSEEEWKIMKGHCEIGYRIAVASPELARIADLILCHHERWDGNGYPQGLKGEEIPLLSRIISVVDAYDAMTNDRPYHEAITSEEALKELERCSGTQFDPCIVAKVIRIIAGAWNKRAN